MSQQWSDERLAEATSKIEADDWNTLRANAVRVRMLEEVRNGPASWTSKTSFAEKLAKSFWMPASAMAAAAILFVVTSSTQTPPDKEDLFNGSVTTTTAKYKHEVKLLKSGAGEPTSVETVAMRSGKVRIKVDPLVDNERFVVTTKNAEVEVRGTEFDVSVNDKQELVAVHVYEGIVDVRVNGDDVVTLTADQSWPVDAERQIDDDEPKEIASQKPVQDKEQALASEPEAESPADDENVEQQATATKEAALAMRQDVGEQAIATPEKGRTPHRQKHRPSEDRPTGPLKRKPKPKDEIRLANAPTANDLQRAGARRRQKHRPTEDIPTGPIKRKAKPKDEIRLAKAPSVNDAQNASVHRRRKATLHGDAVDDLSAAEVSKEPNDDKPTQNEQRNDLRSALLGKQSAPARAMSRGLKRFRDGDYEEAIAIFVALRGSPFESEAAFWAASSSVRTDERQRSIELVEEYLKNANSNEDRTRLVEAKLWLASLIVNDAPTRSRALLESVLADNDASDSQRRRARQRLGK